MEEYCVLVGLARIGLDPTSSPQGLPAFKNYLIYDNYINSVVSINKDQKNDISTSDKLNYDSKYNGEIYNEWDTNSYQQQFC